MYPNDKPGSSQSDPEIRVAETFISSMLAHYFQFEEALGMNVARGAVTQNMTHSYGLQKNPLIQEPREKHLPAGSTVSEAKEKKLILAAMPAYNEEKTIAKMIIRIKKYVDHVLVVDDGSTDATAEIAEALGAHVIRHEINQGYGAALQTIFKTARMIQADILVILDSDDQHDPSDIPSLVKPLDEGYDIVIGSRYIGNNGNHIPIYRIVGMKILDVATQIAGDIKLTDSQSGFRAYGKNAIHSIRLSGQGMSAGSEIVLRAKDNNLSIKEVPISVKYDVERPSTQNPLAHGISVLGNIVGIVGYRRPLISFGVPGSVLTLLGIVASLYAVSALVAGRPFHSIMFIGGITLLILGLLLVTTGLILNSLMQVARRERS